MAREWGDGPRSKGQSQGAKKQGSLLRRATVQPGGYTEKGNRKSRALTIPDALRKYFNPINGESK